MYDVTDVVFREIICKTARPDVFFTEFVNVEALTSQGRAGVIHKFLFKKEQKPIVAQIWGLRPENYFTITKELIEMGFDGVDINMGCPDASAIKSGSCSALIKNHPLATEIIKSTQEAANGQIPVSVKTRLGFSTYQTEEWLGFLLGHNLDAISVHGRTVKQMSKVDANWEEIKKVVELRNKISPDTLIIGNGDVKDRKHGLERVAQTGVDGIMIGRGIFTNPWAFENSETEHTKEEKLELLKEHVTLFVDQYGDTKNFDILKKFFKIYVSDFDGASDLRAKLMECKNKEDVFKIV